MTIEVEEKPHARLGASGWHTWGNCPGSDPLSEGIPSTSSSYAKEGTAAHALLEKCLLGTERNAEAFIGEELVVEGELFVVDNEMADAVNSAVDIVRGYGGTLFVESMVPLAHLTGEADALGTCDIAIISEDGTTLTIADFKYGQGVMVYASGQCEACGGNGYSGGVMPADPETRGEYDAACEMCGGNGKGAPNGQLAMYASGWLQANGFMYEDVTTIRLVILQPRMEWHDEHVITIEELRAFEDVVREAAGRVELNRQLHECGDELQLVPGEKQCKFCKAKGICPALREAASTALATVADPSKLEEFEDLSLPKKAAAVVVNEGVTNERLAEFMHAIPLIEQAIDAAGTEMLRRLSSGMEVPGFYLGVGRAGRRKWINEETARAELTKSGRLKVSEATVAKVKSPTEIEKIAKDTKWWPKIAGLIEQPAGGPKVCVEGVDRNARYQVASAVSEFNDLEATETITKVYAAASHNGMIVETSRSETHVISSSRQTKDVLKLAKVGEPALPLREALQMSLAEPSLEDIMG